MTVAPPVELTVVLPCYRAAAVAARSVDALRPFLERHLPGAWEILVVDDGGGDFGADWPEAGPARLLRLPRNRGKGAAVRAGMLGARGRVRVFTDVDLPYGREALLDIRGRIAGGAHLAIGDRRLRGASYGPVAWRRRAASAAFVLCVAALLRQARYDTQCGLKGFAGEVAEAIFTLAVEDGYAFDVEVLYLASRHGARVDRVPVRLRSVAPSEVRLARDAGRMLRAVLRIRRRARAGGYDSQALAALVARPTEPRP